MVDVLRRAVHARQVAPVGVTEVRVESERLRVPAELLQRALRRAQQSRKPHNEARVVFVREALAAMTALLAEQIGGRGGTIDEEDRRLLREDLRTSYDVKVMLNTAWLPLTPQKLLADLWARPAYLAAVTPGWSDVDPADAPAPRGRRRYSPG